MASQTKPRESQTAPAVARKSAPSIVKGRRSFFEYVDLGVTDASDERMRVQIIKGKKGMVKPTGWHYHVCEGQFVYMTGGWLEIEFADGVCRLEEGDPVYIPGGLPHNEIRTSDDMQLLEMSVPAKMSTVPCNAPG